MNKYPILAKEMMLHITPEGGTLYTGPVPLQTLNRPAADILSLCDGRHSLDEICGMLAKKYNDSIERVRDLVINFSKKSEERGNILFTNGEMFEKPIIGGNKNFWAPIAITVEITSQCDLSCIHCYAEAGARKRNEVSFEKWIKVLDGFHRAGTRLISITGGDPLAYPHIFQILDFCEDKFKVRLLTSGYRVNKDIVEKLSRYKNLEMIQVSLDGPDKETHDYIRGKKGSFEKATNAIRLLSEVGILTHVGMMAFRLNKDKIEDTIKLADKLGANVFAVGRVISLGRATKHDLSLTVDEMMSIGRDIEKFSQKYSHKNFNVRTKDNLKIELPLPSGDNEEKSIKEEILMKQNELLKIIGGNCGAGYRSMFINSIGVIKSCNLWDYTIGDVSKQSVEEILKSIHTQFCKDLKAPNSEMCSDCGRIYLCFGCHAHADIYSNNATHCKWKEQLICTPH
ncbi:MAG: PqqD family peptide modification chaperone [Candidatus Methanoperedens sp.]|nr:PqqD family peptide modification chaperone [Candidatus Methanoperedens sp.]